MRKFLSLVLALVMMMSLVTINAGAKEFTDGKDITYDEAVDVISTVKVVDGYANGSFNPGGNLTRGAAAKIICNLILGPTTAAELHADTAPYRDVPVSHDFAGYIAYCQKEGIISGYADGSFRPGGTLTGYAFMKMLLGALGYDAEIEQYTGPNWSINVAKRAIGIGLNKGLEKTFNGVDYITREEACLYAFNTLQADLVQYDSRITTTINGAQVTVGNSQAESRKWDSQATRVNNIRVDNIVQFAEEYFNKLEKKIGDDDFMRPAYTWVYDKEEIGTYVDWQLMQEEYTDEVTGRDLYDLLGASLLDDDDMNLVYYFNGVEPVNGCGLPAWVLRGKSDNGSGNIGYDDLRRSNQEAVGFTARGALTQVFVDKDVREKIIITTIDTWLAQAGADYSESRETSPINVWTEQGTDSKKTYNVDVMDVPEIVDVKEDTFYLTQISFKSDLDNGEPVSLWEPEIIEDSAITKFSLPNAKNQQDSDQVPDEITTNGDVYKKAIRGYYDPAALDAYDNTLLTDRKYNVFVDQFGYMIGIELDEGAKNYVFITGFDRPASNLSVKTADAAAIFLDGTMQAIKVNVTDTDKNIETARNNHTNKSLNDAAEYFIPWQRITTDLGQEGFHALNRWFTYTVNDAGVYTLKPAVRMLAYKNTAKDETIKTANLYLDDNVMYEYPSAITGDYDPYNMVKRGPKVTPPTPQDYVGTRLNAFKYTAGGFTARAYGNDDSVYITVETDIVDYLTADSGSITGVTGVYTGVQNIEIELNRADIQAERPIDEAYVYAVYDSNNYIIGAVTVGEANGGDAIIAYVTDGVQSERIEDGFYYWEFKAIVKGEEQTLTVKEKYGSVFTGVDKSQIVNEASHLYKGYVNGVYTSSNERNWNAFDGLIELRMDADDYVTSVKPVAEKDIYSYFGNKYDVDPNREGNHSIVSSADTFNHTTGPDFGIGDAKAYRIGVIKQEYVNQHGSAPSATYGHTTWSNTIADTYHHYYDSAPEVLTLVGRTLYVTGDKTMIDHDTGLPYAAYQYKTPYDEGLALASDAKFFVIQRENSKWKTRDFSSASSAIAQVQDVEPNVDGKQFSGEVIAIMNGKAQAETVIIISYAELRSGGQATGGANLTGIDVTSLGVTFDTPSDHDNTYGYNLGYDAYKQHIDFVLEGATLGKTYTVKLQQMNADGKWIDVGQSITVKYDPTYNTSKAHYEGTYNGNPIFTWGQKLNSTGGWQYRLVCGNVISGLIYA